MAVTISDIELAAALMLDAATASRLLAVATALVEQYGATAPEAIENEAVIRTSGYLHGQPKDAVRAASAGSLSVDHAPSRQAALRHSGAMALLSPFKVRRAGVVG